LIAAITSTGAAVVLALLRDALGITPGLAGMMMVWALHMSITFMFLITTFTEAEAAATSVERVVSLARDTPLEAPHTLQEAQERLGWGAGAEMVAAKARAGAGAAAAMAVAVPGRPVAAPEGWPFRGELSFEDVRLRYRCIRLTTQPHSQTNKRAFMRRSQSWPHCCCCCCCCC